MPFDVGKGLVSEVEFSYGGFAGKATYDPFDIALVGDQAVPRKIRFESGGGPLPWLTMGVELVGGVPECTYLELDADDGSPVRDKHLRMIRVEKFVSLIVATCGNPVTRTSETGIRIDHGPATPEQVKAVERLQRRRRDPNDRELLERVAAIYKRTLTHPWLPSCAPWECLDVPRAGGPLGAVKPAYSPKSTPKERSGYEQERQRRRQHLPVEQERQARRLQGRNLLPRRERQHEAVCRLWPHTPGRPRQTRPGA